MTTTLLFFKALPCAGTLAHNLIINVFLFGGGTIMYMSGEMGRFSLFSSYNTYICDVSGVHRRVWKDTSLYFAVRHQSYWPVCRVIARVGCCIGGHKSTPVYLPRMTFAHPQVIHALSHWYNTPSM